MRTFKEARDHIMSHVYGNIDQSSVRCTIHQVWGQAWTHVIDQIECKGSDQIWRYVCFQILGQINENI